MILPLEKSFIKLFVLSNTFSFCYSEENDGYYEFGEVELYSDVQDPEYYVVNIKGLAMLEGYSEKVDHKNLCLQAKEYALLDGMYFNYKEYETKAYRFFRPNKEVLITYAQKCDTIPISFSRFDPEVEKLKVMIRQNLFENREYTIEVENVKTIPVPRPDILKIPLPELWKQRMDDDITTTDRLDICLAAKKQIQRNVDGAKPKMLNTDPPKMAIFTIESLNGTGRNRVAIPCPSYPQIYVHFEKNYRHMVAVFVENQRKLEDIKISSTQKDTPSGLALTGLEEIRSEYKFEVQSTKHVLECYRTSLSQRFSCNPGYDLYKFHEDELKNLCIVAKENASLDGLVDSDNIYKIKKYAISYPQISVPELEDTMCVIGVKCKTIPISYLRLGNSEYEIKIAIEKNSFLEIDRKFEVEVVMSYPKPVKVVSPKRFAIPGFDRESKVEKERKKQSISQLFARSERLEICVAARTIVRQKKLGEPVLQTSEVREAEELEFESSQGIRTEMVVMCPSSPVMYVYFDQSPQNINIILVK